MNKYSIFKYKGCNVCLKNNSLTIKSFHINDVILENKFSFSSKLVTIDKTITTVADNFESVNISVIRPEQHKDIVVNQILDIIPISTKVIGKIGEGITHTLTGVYILLTGANSDPNKFLPEYGCSKGILSEQLVLNKAGTPNNNDLLIHIDIIAKKDVINNRQLFYNMFLFADQFIQPLRELLKLLDGKIADNVETYYNSPKNNNKPNVVLVKQLEGQGALYESQLFADEPSSIQGGISIVDINNMPVFVTTNEYRDGIVHAMT